ncbi:MAG: hypothetical protein OHK0013_45950 [Sandaracinaceae bacterium]
MQSLTHGWSWARSLLLVARARVSGSLMLRAHGRAASIQVREGAVVGFEGDLGPRLGELLGGLVGSAPAGEPFGAHALAHGQVNRSALAWALRRQMRIRARELRFWGDVEARWEPGRSDERPFTDPMDACDLVAEALRAAAQHAGSVLPEHLGRPGVALTTLGAWWAERAALYPHEIAALRARGDTSAGGSAGRRFLAAARVAGLVERPISAPARELARVHAVWRRGGSEAVLGPARDREGRRARFRQVASAVHPDRFHADPELEQISHHIVSRLSELSPRTHACARG